MSPVGLVVALDAEARAVAARSVPRGQTLALAAEARLFLCGMGSDAAAGAARALIANDVCALVSIGFAGALDPALSAGDCLAPASIWSESGHYETDAAWRGRLLNRLHPVLVVSETPLMTLPTPVVGAAQRDRIHTTTGACAVDMESAAIAGVAHEAGLPFLCLRVILDEARSELPTAVSRTDAFGRPHWRAFATAVVSHPGQIIDWMRLCSSFYIASTRLRAAIVRCGPGLAFH